MKHVVGVADSAISSNSDDMIVTHALGSCLGITIHDPVAGVGGMMHAMMPVSSINPEKAKVNPLMFIDTGVPAFFKEIYAVGGQKSRLVVKVAGGAQIQSRGTDTFAIGKRNMIMLKKILWKNGVLIEGEDVGADHARTMYLEISTGRVWVTTRGQQKEL